jgi:DNA-binding MarR family transcriptional regulator
VRPDTGNELVDAILHAAHRVRTAADADLRAGGLSLPGFKLLKALSQQDRSMREVSDILHLAPRTVTDIIDGLQARGLVVRHPHPSDRRITLLHLTEAGADRLTSATTAADRARDAAISGLDDDERATLRRLLARVGVARAAVPATSGAPGQPG